jgi:hypothetical protein
MSNVDQILQRAAEETRRTAMQRWPAPMETRRPARPAWLAFAAAFTLVVVAFGLIPLLAGTGEPAPVGDPTQPTAPLLTSSTVSETTLGTEPTGSCPSSEVAAPQTAEDLPDAVAETRDAIIAAAMACDFDMLESVAGESFSTSFGGGGSENLSIWNDRGLDPTVTLLHLLDMSHATVPDPAGDIYVWPAAYAYATWEQVDQDDLDELAMIHSEGELDSFASANGYLGWRIGISEDGTWLFFIAGD